jgi:hypothetical protein
MVARAEMNTQKEVIDELKCVVCGDVLRSDPAQQCSSVKQKALEPTRETVRRHRWRYAINREGTEVGWVCRACWKALEQNRGTCSDRPACGIELNVGLSLGDG